MNSSEWQHICNEADIGDFIRAEPLNDQHWKITTQHACFFVKTTLKHQGANLASEQHSLNALRTTSVHVPNIIARGETHKKAWLILDWLTLFQDGDWATLGTQLAQLHQQTQTSFGWFEDNAIEQIVQYNRQLDDWVSFFRSQRLVPQLRLAAERGLPHQLYRQIQDIMQQLDTYFTHDIPTPNLVHGNLNMHTVSFLADGQPVVFDPACYFGDAETDMATCTTFPDAFHSSYRMIRPIHDQQKSRHALYQLYHQLIHFNRDGGRHVPFIEHTIRTIIHPNDL